MPPDHLVDHDKFNVYSKMLDLLRRIGRTADAASAYRLAVDNCCNKVERDFLMRQQPKT